MWFNHYHRGHLMKKLLITVVACLLLLAGEANAKGCLKGALIGGLAGHVAGKHAVLGAVGGCIVGRHLAKKNEQPSKSGKR